MRKTSEVDIDLDDALYVPRGEVSLTNMPINAIEDPLAWNV